MTTEWAIILACGRRVLPGAGGAEVNSEPATDT